MEINITQAKEAITDSLTAGLVPNLIGSPGVGKSDLIREVANEWELKVIDVRLAQMDPTDLNGFPSLNKDRTRSHYAAPSTFPLEGDPIPEGYKGWLLFFDEMPSAPMSVQAAAYKIVLDRMIGEQHLHKRVAIVCAGNKATDKAIVNRLSTAMQSRLIHLNLRIDAKAWFDWASGAGIDHRITGFLRFRPDLLWLFKADHADDTFPCPRTWHFLSKLITKNKWDTIGFDKLAVMAGTVGEGPATEFKGFTDIYEKLPTIEQMISNPETVIIPEEPSTRYAITALVGNKATLQNIDQLMVIVNRLPVEFQVITLQNITKGNKDLRKADSIRAWVAANANELV